MESQKEEPAELKVKLHITIHSFRENTRIYTFRGLNNIKLREILEYRLKNYNMKHLGVSIRNLLKFYY